MDKLRTKGIIVVLRNSKFRFPSLVQDNEATIEDTEEGNEDYRDEVDSKVLQTENSFEKICKDSGKIHKRYKIWNTLSI